MSGTSYVTICPECRKETLVAYCNYKPYDNVSGTCLNCGFGYYTKEEKLSKKELREQQKAHEYNPKTERFE